MAYDYSNVLAAIAKGVDFNPLGNLAEGWMTGRKMNIAQQQADADTKTAEAALLKAKNPQYDTPNSIQEILWLQAHPQDTDLMMKLKTAANPYMVLGPGQTPVPKPGSGAPPIKGPPQRPTEENLKNAGFYERMKASDAILSDPGSIAAASDLKQRVLSGVPMVGNYLNSEQFQQFDQAQRDFVNAVLRRESGAAINESEFQNARKQYFPVPGDGPKVLAQKARNRQIQIENLQRSAGPANPDAPSDSGAGNPMPTDDPRMTPDVWNRMSPEDQQAWINGK